MRTLTTAIRCLPLCSLLFLMAAEDDCVIRVESDDDDEDDECVDLNEYCPQLGCEVYASDDNGCPICECAVGEGEGEGEGECQSDADCGDGFACEIYEECSCAQPGMPDDGNDDRACEAECRTVGYCVDITGVGCEAVLCAPGFICVEDPNGSAQCVMDDSDLCQSDSECQQGERCNLDVCINPDCMNSPDGACEPVCTHGLCEPVSGECFSDVDCGEGFHCEFGGTEPNCDPQNGQNCEVDCDPSTGNCGDRPIAAPGFCVENIPVDDCAALCGPNSECLIFEDGSVGCVPVQTAECVSDQDCGQGLTCNAADVCLSDPACNDPNTDPVCTDVCWGFCVEAQPTSCQADADCAAGQICELQNTCDACPDGSPNCFAPCPLEGVCVGG